MKILYLVPRLPDTLEKGDKLRAYFFLKLLSQNHQIILIAAEKEVIQHNQIQDLSSFTEQIYLCNTPFLLRIWGLLKGIFNAVPFQVLWFSHNRVKKTVQRIIHSEKPDLILCHTVRMAHCLSGINENITSVIDFQDAFGLNMEKRIDSEKWWFRPLMKLEAQRLKNYETTIFSQFDHHLVISENDRKNIAHPFKEQIHIVANGVNLPELASAEKDIDILFVGNMSYLPNVEAMSYFYQQVFPLLKKENPNINMYIVGNSPTPKITAMQQPHLTVTGWVDNVNTYYGRSKVFVAPMQISTGLQNKILEAMSNRIPCVVSEQANLALKGTHLQNVIIAHTPEDYQNAITRLLEDTALHQSIANAGYEFVKNNYSWPSIGLALETLLNPQSKKSH